MCAFAFANAWAWIECDNNNIGIGEATRLEQCCDLTMERAMACANRRAEEAAGNGALLNAFLKCPPVEAPLETIDTVN